MLRIGITIFLVLLLAGCQVPFSLGGQLRPDQLSFPALDFTLPEVTRYRLENGMQVYLNEDHELPLVNISVTLAGGSVNDPKELTGLSELFAATLESGGFGDLTPEQVDTELESRAIELSVGATDYSYQIDLSLHRRDLALGLRLLADLLRRPQFDAERFELVRHQMLEAIYRRNDNPAGIAARLLAEETASGHPFGRQARVETVTAISRQDLVALHSRCFRAGNVWLAVSGDLTRGELDQLLGSQFADWPAGTPAAPALPPLPEESEARILVADKDLPQTTILMGQRGISKDNPDMYALQVANYILGGGGFNSRLMREIRSNRGLAYSVYSYFNIGRRLPQLFVAAAETKSASTAEVVRLMLEQLQALIDVPVAEQELSLAKQSLINSFVFAFDNSHAVVARQVRLDFYAYPQGYLEDYRRNIAAVTIEDVRRVAEKYLKPDHLQIILVGKSELFVDSLQQFGLPVKRVDL